MLSDKRSRFNGFDCCTLDEIRADYAIPFGLLKADIEGMGDAFVRGARKTIEQDRPMLSLAVYHNEEEFVGIYRMLKAWDLDYKFEFKALNPFTAYGEVTLLAYPAEWAES
ncbi:MAG: FkbM family methyltransferase [Lentisphaerae bacterium]|nr:FkbM family methyltransferase [Lentisphaerota bacterium]